MVAGDGARVRPAMEALEGDDGEENGRGERDPGRRDL